MILPSMSYDMLLIGDIHINAKYKDKILTALKERIANHPEEQHLIFLGDFVYHFSYDRSSLLALYDLFLELYQQGKSLYILAGNHDRLGNNFVFEEAKKAFQMFSQLFPKEQTAQGKSGSIQFITTPLLTTIEGKPFCFLPYMLDINLAVYPGIEQLQDHHYEAQLQTGNKNLILSAKLHLLLQYFKQHQPALTIVHHYYFDNVAFPGQKSKFSFRDVALSSQRLDDTEIQFISGHLHQPFSYKNYFCTGSVRATSPLEENQLKGIRKYAQGKRSFYQLGINFYFSIQRKEQTNAGLFATETPLTLADIHQHHLQLQQQFNQLFSSLSLP
ncbi:MAG: metallophosphoesterase [Candidatus Peribacteria bacterium]|jgi:predicted phosphodiesterase|nr:metallophosphoesterase [Candidatus Peribacteria bacterium]